MDKDPPAVPISENTRIILDELRELREDFFRHEQKMEKILTFVEQQCELLQHQSMQAPVSEFTSAFPSVWMPSCKPGNVIEPIQSSLKIRTIQALPIQQNDIVTTLRNTWLGKIYISHLKSYVVVRWITHWFWRNGYPLYINYIATRFSSRKEKRWRPLIRLNEITNNRGAITYKLTDAAVVDAPEPKVFPVDDQIHLKAPRDGYKFPEIYVAIINNAITYGGTNLVLTDGQVVCHDLYDFKRDYTSEELHGRTLIDPKSKRIRWLLNDVAPESIPVAATFVDACASNYAHWLTEVLPRIVLFCAEDRFSGIPIVVNAGLHKNIMESLLLVVGADREIITLPIGRALLVKELYLTSAAGYVPFERRTNKLSDHSHGVFSSLAFERVRKYLNALEQMKVGSAWPEKIFLRRNSGARKVNNSVQLEGFLISQGYVIIEPEKLTFLQQFQLFSHAKEIISPTGAALANAIFCMIGTQVIILMGKHKDMIYRYWTNMLSPHGIRVNYVLGHIVGNHDLGIHGDFEIDMDSLNCLLQGLKGKSH